MSRDLYCKVKAFPSPGVEARQRCPVQDFASVLVAQQNMDGSWPASYGGQILGTVWALLTLEFVFPDIVPPEVWCVETVNPHGKNVPPAGKTTLPGPKGGENEDGFYQLFAEDNRDENPNIWVGVPGVPGSWFGPFSSGVIVKITEAAGAAPSIKKIGSSNGQAGAVTWHITLPSDPVLVAIDDAGNRNRCRDCLVPPLPK